MWSQFRPMPPAYFSYWDDDAVGQPRRREDVLRHEPSAHFPGQRAYRVGLLRRGLVRRQVRVRCRPTWRPATATSWRSAARSSRPVLSQALGRRARALRAAAGARRSMPTVPQTYLTMRAWASRTTARRWPCSPTTSIRPAPAAATATRRTGHLVLPPNAQGYHMQTVRPNVYSQHGARYVTNGACDHGRPGPASCTSR